jgi:hypothetical protein
MWISPQINAEATAVTRVAIISAPMGEHIPVFLLIMALYVIVDRSWPLLDGDSFLLRNYFAISSSCCDKWPSNFGDCIGWKTFFPTRFDSNGREDADLV